jgi:ATP-dependent protease HslVU (ClpYQ) peptidase subunit
MITDDRTSAWRSHDMVLARLEEVLSEENAALGRNDLSNLAAFTERKAHCLVELTRAVRSIPHGGASDRLSKKLQALCAVLDTNRKLLASRLRAVADISAILSRTLNCATSDGTYSPGSARGSNGP